MNNLEERYDIPIVIMVFNRPKHTRILLSILSQLRPTQLFVVADGPRDFISSDFELCQEVRNIIDCMVDWPCKLYKNFREDNLGCGLSPARGVDWVFEYVDRVIILEDDCLPSASFFLFCREGLNRFAKNDKVMMISGNNHLLNKKNIDDSYFFSINTQTHGWATWKRAWKKYDFYMSDWPRWRSLYWLYSMHRDVKYALKWLKLFDEVYKNANSKVKYDCWDFQWTYACWKNKALNVIPKKNLVSNIGYGDDATHATPPDHPLSNLVAEELSFPLNHPAKIEQDRVADAVLARNVYGNYSIIFKVWRKLKKLVNRQRLFNC
jgi:hypothetical protein